MNFDQSIFFISLQSSGLSLSLPKNVHLLSFEPWKSNSILVRFDHILEKGEDERYSKPVSFNFQEVFKGFDVAGIRETTLAANQWLDEAKHLNFSTKIEQSNEAPASTDVQYTEIPEEIKFGQHEERSNDEDGLTINLKPMEIRTFVVELKRKSHDD